MQSLSKENLRHGIKAYLERATAGESFELTSHGTPTGACLVPAKSSPAEMAEEAANLHLIRKHLLGSELEEFTRSVQRIIEGKKR